MNTTTTLPVSDHAARTIRRVADTIAAADALLITAGAGMSADSGLAVFRGNTGFWRAYPPLAAQHISFERMAQPVWFDERPRMAWAFYGHRLQLYRDAVPHAGHALLRSWAARAAAGSFVVSSNVDGQFIKAGFDPDTVAEQHGSIHRLQCRRPCSGATWDAPVADLDIDLHSFEARGELPRCPHCGEVARPNILMFNDDAWIDTVTRQQQRAFDHWLSSVRGRRVVVLETGAGTAIPTIRRIGERAAERPRTTLVRINPEAREMGDEVVNVPLPALQALRLIDAAMTGSAKGGMRRVPRRRTATLRNVHYVDLHDGMSVLVDVRELTFAERQSCLAHWKLAAQGRFVPMPALRGMVTEGYTMRGRIVSPPGRKPGSVRGGALLQLRDPRGELVTTTGFAWRPREGAYLWRLLTESARTPVQPMEYPGEPWIVRRQEPAAGRNAAALGAVSAVGLAVGVAWLGEAVRGGG